MLDLILESISTIISNIIIFLIIPFIWWLIKYRKDTSFFKWLGLIKPKLNSRWWMIIIFIIAYGFFYLFDFTMLMDGKSLEVMQTSETISVNVYTNLGVVAIIPALLKTFIANGFCEEVFFRGFICKRLCNKFGKTVGVIIQGIIFGGIHNMLYILGGVGLSLQSHIIVFIFTGMGGLLLGVLDEKVYNGSIIPSVFLHGLGNFISNLNVIF